MSNEQYWLTADQMFTYFQAGAIGTKEFRSFLAKYDERFKDIRDPDVDNEIDAEARRRQQALATDALRLIDKEGHVREVE